MKFDENGLLDKDWLINTNSRMSVFILTTWENQQGMVDLILSDNRIFRKFFIEIQDLRDARVHCPHFILKFVEKFVIPENFFSSINTTEKLGDFVTLATLKCNNWLTKQQINESFCKALKFQFNKTGNNGIIPIISFLKDNTKLYYKEVNKLKIALEMYHAVTDTKMIDQHKRNLCGIVVVLSIWLMDDPATCMYSFIQLLKTGFCEFPLSLQASSFSRDNDDNFSDIFLSAIKNSSNTFGYSPNLFEKFRSATEPGMIYNLLHKIGNRKVTEATKLLTTNNNDLAWFYFILDPNIYAKDHTQFKNKKESFNKLLNKYDDGHHIIMYITLDLGKAIKSKNQQIDATVADSILGVASHHYVLLRDIQYDESNKKINVTIWTWGGEYQASIDEDFFFENFFGFISAEKRTPVSEAAAQLFCTTPSMA